MPENLCPYSLFALQFYALFPLVKIGRLINLPDAISYLLALAAPALLLDTFIKLVQSKTKCLTFVEHPSPSKSGAGGDHHQHTSAITFGVIGISSILGLLFTIGLSFLIEAPQSHLQPLGIYLMLLSFFHFSEYLTTSLTNPSTLNLSSFLLDQSIAYALAISSSFIEFLVESYYFPNSKQLDYVAALGLALALVGELTRKTAMFTAGKSFTHTIVSERRPHHRLVTSGIYGLVRHPSYAGWFYWAIGTQIFLKNPACALLFAVISHNFFKERIQYEEQTLIRFFGAEYLSYRKKVKLWMPIM